MGTASMNATATGAEKRRENNIKNQRRYGQDAVLLDLNHCLCARSTIVDCLDPATDRKRQAVRGRHPYDIPWCALNKIPKAFVLIRCNLRRT